MIHQPSWIGHRELSNTIYVYFVKNRQATQWHGGVNVPDSFTLEQRQSYNLQCTSAPSSSTFSLIPRRRSTDWCTHTHTHISCGVQLLNPHLPHTCAHKSSELFAECGSTVCLHCIYQTARHLWPPECWQQHGSTGPQRKASNTKLRHTLRGVCCGNLRLPCIRIHKTILHWCYAGAKKKRKMHSCCLTAQSFFLDHKLNFRLISVGVKQHLYCQSPKFMPRMTQWTTLINSRTNRKMNYVRIVTIWSTVWLIMQQKQNQTKPSTPTVCAPACSCALRA